MPAVSAPGESDEIRSDRDDENLNKRNYARRNHKMKLFVGTITLIYVGGLKLPGNLFAGGFSKSREIGMPM